ncbi:carbohydrate porin [Paraburkholderia sediminicola]|uniref:carbohydrate porin n=1 Tax=Paraburkholderia sediminicola TaxID=458836 RepID=UPI0038BCB05D
MTTTASRRPARSVGTGIHTAARRRRLLYAVGLGIAMTLSARAAQADDSIAEATKTSNCLAYDQNRARGLETPLSTTCDSVSPGMGGLREKMYENGWVLQGGISSSLTYDVLHPSNSVPQSYTGQRPTYGQSALAVLTYDLSRVGFSKDSQFIVAGMWNETSYLGAGVRSAFVSELSIEQEFFNHQVRINYGFQTPTNEFYGFTLGTTVASSALGPASSMFYELGVPSIKPAPTFDIRVYASDMRLYNHFAVTRSMSPQGFQADSQDNSSGLSFSVPGARALFMDEVGYRILSAPNQRAFWVRAGALYNTSDYMDYGVGRPTYGNKGFYFAVTRQFTQPDAFYSYRGIYADLKVDYADASKNPFSRDVAATIYSLGPFASRPYDMVSAGFTHQWISQRTRQFSLLATGVPMIAGSNTYSVSYAMHVMRGVYWTNSIAYTTQPVLAPSHAAALLLTTGATVVF